jgi:hypothetical protein
MLEWNLYIMPDGSRWLIPGTNDYWEQEADNHMAENYCKCELEYCNEPPISEIDKDNFRIDMMRVKTCSEFMAKVNEKER